MHITHIDTQIPVSFHSAIYNRRKIKYCNVIFPNILQPVHTCMDGTNACCIFEETESVVVFWMASPPLQWRSQWIYQSYRLPTTLSKTQTHTQSHSVRGADLSR